MAGRFREKYGPWALVAGASEGLGAAFAEAIAARGVDLILIARRGDALEAVAASLRAQHGVEVRVASLDLARADASDEIARLIADVEVGLGVYNAAFAPVGDFVEEDSAALSRVLDVNARGPMLFARMLAPAMATRGRGGIVLMSSLAGFQGAPRLAAYGATKAFNIALGESLWRELKPQDVDVVVCCAGAVRTPGYAKSAGGDAPGTLDARVVAEAALDGLGHGPQVIPGMTNKFARFVLGRLLPRRMAIEIMARSTQGLT